MADRISAKGVTPDEDISNDALDLIEITGVIKWFDVAKGFGFIVPDNGMQDVLVMSPACAAMVIRPFSKAPVLLP